jgi:nitric oxide dioxygenase
MLSDTSFPVVEATLPVVGEHIQEIARRFYRHMFEARPDLQDGLFNRGNQADGRQQQALAGSVAAFATYLVNHPEQTPDRLLSRIAHKHASLGLAPDQYQVVHDHLMWAIVDVLGDAVTPAVAAAWDEVYWLMANMLINIERGLYGAIDLTPETVWRTWRVAQRTQETRDVVTFVLERTDERAVKRSLPGQYVTVRMTMPDGVQQPRQYSLTRADDGQHRQFSVKRVRGVTSPTGSTPDGEMSSLLHDHVGVGDELVLSAPFGDVVLEYTDRPLVLASAGIGITPMAGMLSHLVKADAQRRVTLLHADDRADTFALRNQVEEDLGRLSGALFTWFLEAPESGERATNSFPGFMDVGAVDLPEDAQYYLCGPLPFLQSVRSGLVRQGVAPKDIQYEVFGPDLWLADFQ